MRRISSSVIFCTSSRARFSSSSLIFFSLASFLRASLPSRRTLRTAVRCSSRTLLRCLHHVAAALLGHGRNGNADDLAVGDGIEAEIGGLDGLLNLLEDGGVPGRDEDELRLGRGDLRHLVDGRVRAVVVHLDLVEHVHAGAAGARGGQVGLEVGDCLIHAPLEVAVEVFERRIAGHEDAIELVLARELPDCQRLFYNSCGGVGCCGALMPTTARPVAAACSCAW